MSTNFSENSDDCKLNFYCELCDYKCSRKQHMKQHFLTQSHKNKEINKIVNVENSDNQNNLTDNKFICLCGKSYKERSGLWRHEKKCSHSKAKETKQINENSETDEINELDDNAIPPELTDKQVISLLVQQNMKLVQDNNDFKSMVLEVIKNGTHNTNNNTTHTNSHNKTFNLNIFLNEQCKDAVNMSDFVDSLIIELADLEKTGRTNFVEGISNLILKNLRALDRNKRPIHCSDLKRETLYIKDNDKWERESDDKVRIKNIIRGIANENIKKIADWTKKYPDCRLADSRKNDLYLNIVMNSMCGGSPEETQKNLNDIIRNIAKEVVIQK